MLKRKTHQLFIWLAVFSIAMGLLEGAVVIYIREIYYPLGFTFPLQVISSKIMKVELLREIATILMLVSVGVFTGRTKTEKFGFFLFSFAVWDIFYYVFLKLFLNWPESFFTWDVLFLIPLTWVGPVLCPLLLSLAMIALSILINYRTNAALNFKLQYNDWALLIVGSIIVITSFVWEYTKFMLVEFRFLNLFRISNLPELMERGLKFIPQDFPWLIFFAGFVTILFPIIKGFFIQKINN